MREVKRAKKLRLFDCGEKPEQEELTRPISMPVQVSRVYCGGMHTLALAPNGAVYSWGCNDEGALGRTGHEDSPRLVEALLPNRITGCASGDSHSVFFNDKTSQAWMCGLYRVSANLPGDNLLIELSVWTSIRSSYVTHPIR